MGVVRCLTHTCPRRAEAHSGAHGGIKEGGRRGVGRQGNSDDRGEITWDALNRTYERKHTVYIAIVSTGCIIAGVACAVWTYQFRKLGNEIEGIYGQLDVEAIDGVGERMENHAAKSIDTLAEKVDAGHQNLDASLTRLEQSLGRFEERMDIGCERFDERMDRLEKRMVNRRWW